MAINSYKFWDDEDVRALESLYQQGFDRTTIARCLQRTPRAVDHALKHLLIQQTLHHGTEKTAEKYDTTPETLYMELAPEIYYAPDKPAFSYCPLATIILALTAFLTVSMFNV